MSIAAIQDLIERHSLDRELLSQFIDFDSGEVTQCYESEYWDYKRDPLILDDEEVVAELAADVLSFHNTKGGYILHGITNSYSLLGVDERTACQTDSNRLNDKIKKYVGTEFYCRYSPIAATVGGTRKIFPVIFIPRRKRLAVRVLCNAPGQKPAFKKGEIFLRVGDHKKRAETDSELTFASTPPTFDDLVGLRQVRIESPKPGFTLLKGDHSKFYGNMTRTPRINEAIEGLLYEKWDVVLLRGVGGVGKTAAGIEVTRRLTFAPEYERQFGGIISISTKDQELSPYAIRGDQPEFLYHGE